MQPKDPASGSACLSPLQGPLKLESPWVSRMALRWPEELGGPATNMSSLRSLFSKGKGKILPENRRVKEVGSQDVC